MSTSSILSNRKGLVAWTLSALFYAYVNIIIVIPSIIKTDLINDIYRGNRYINNKEFGFITTTALLISYAIMQIPFGVLLDRLSIRKVLATSCLICGLSTVAFGYVHTYSLVIVTRVLTGLGAASAALCTFKLASNWFDDNQFATLTGLLLTIGGLGAILANEPYHWLSVIFSYRTSIILIGFAGIAFSVLIFLFVNDAPDGSSKSNAPAISIATIRSALAKKETYIISLYGMLLYTAYGTLKDTWGNTFIKAAFPNLTYVGAINSLLVLGFILGAPFFGWYSDRIKKRKPVLLISLIGSMMMLVSIIIPGINSSVAFFAAVYFLIGFFISGFLPSFSVMKEINSVVIVATSMGIMNTFNNMGELFLVPLIGHLMDRADQISSHDLANPAQSFASIQHTFLVLPFILIFALVLYFLIPETHAKQHENGDYS